MEARLGLRSVDISITSSCNLKCKHCYLEDLKNAKIILPFRKIEEVLTDARDLGAHHVTLTGGEPTLHPKFPEILTLANKLGFKITIFTNATTLNEDIVSVLKECNINGVQVSLEGLKEMHEKIRGKGTFERTISGIKLLVDAGIRVTVNTQLTKGIIDNIQEYASFLKSTGVSKLLLTIPSLVGEAKKNNVCFPDEKLDKIRSMLKIHKLKDQFNIDSTNPDSNYTCTALIHQLAINFDGTVYPCHYFRSTHHHSLGNIYVESLRDIYISWMNGDSELLHYQKYGTAKCNVCKFKEVCEPCAGRIYSLYKNFKNPDLLCCMLLGKEKVFHDVHISRLVWGRME